MNAFSTCSANDTECAMRRTELVSPGSAPDNGIIKSREAISQNSVNVEAAISPGSVLQEGGGLADGALGERRRMIARIDEHQNEVIEIRARGYGKRTPSRTTLSKADAARKDTNPRGNILGKSKFWGILLLVGKCLLFPSNMLESTNSFVSFVKQQKHNILKIFF